MKRIKNLFMLASVALISTAASAQMSKISNEKTVMVGGAAMYPSKNIIQNAVNSKDHTTLVAAVKAAGLVETLEGAGPFTVFAPTNEAFAKLPAGTVDNLLKPENKKMLQTVLTYHVISGRLSAADLAAKIKAGGGTASIATVAGPNLMFKMKGNKIWVMDTSGNKGYISISNVNQSNGVIHVINTVMVPKS